MKKVHLIFIFLIFVTLCTGLLICSLLIPQNTVYANVQDSLMQLNIEGNYPCIFDSTADANMLDNTTDSLMLMQSYYSSTWDSLWKNAWNRHEDGLIAGLNETILAQEQANYTYSRYWGGFRVTLRFLLSFFSFTEIRHINAVVFFVLFAMALLTVYKHSDYLCAIAFAVSIILIRPEIISNSPHFSCCFIISFLSMVLMPTLLRKNIPLPAIFVSIGCLTQFFDYYTVPIVTFVYPFIMAQLINRSNKESRGISILAQSFFAWLISWIVMWLSKLALTSLFTDENAFIAAFASAGRRLGFEKIESLEYSYNPIAAVIAVLRTLCQSPAMLFFLACVLITFVAACAIKLKPRKLNFTIASQYIYIASLPILWYAVTCSPTVLHAFFQYRGISATLFSGLIFIVQLFSNSVALYSEEKEG